MLNILALFMANKNLVAKEIKPYINTSFIRDLFKQLHHPDERIREGIKTIIHQFYVQFVGHRTFIRRNIRDQLLTFTYEDDSYRGTPHILQVMGSIVRGYSTPLKNEHKVFLVKEWFFNSNELKMPLKQAYKRCTLIFFQKVDLSFLNFFEN